MTSLDEIRSEYEQADSEAVELSGEYQKRVDNEVTAPWNALKAEYADRISAANEKAAQAQQKYLDYEAASALLDDPDAEGKLAGFTGPGGDRIRAAYQDLTA